MAEELPKLGVGSSTDSGNKTAIEIYDFWQIRYNKGPTLDLTEPSYVEGDNLQALLIKFGYWLARTPIPKSHDENFEPKLDNTGFLIVTTVTIYFGKIKTQLRKKFPNHEDWKSEENPMWWTAMRNDFIREAERAQVKGSDFFGDPRTRSLFESNQVPGLAASSRDQCLNDWISKIDLRAICRNMLMAASLKGKRSDACERRCWLVLGRHVVARGGEGKFQQFSEWVWLPRLELVDAVWVELKTRSRTAMGFVSPRDSYLCDIYHAFGSFWAVEDGLFRSKEQFQKGIHQFVFPNLHRFVDATVTTKLTNAIRDFMPTGVPVEIKNSFSAKSLRKGAILELAVHPEIGPYESTGRSGHSLGNSQESYMDGLSVARSLPGGRALAGWSNTTRQIYPPRLDIITGSAAAEVERFMDALYVISDCLSDFLPGGHLRMVLRTCTASLIMHYPTMMEDCGVTNVVIDKLRSTANSAKIHDDECPGENPLQVLAHWAVKIKEDYQARNAEIVPADNSIILLTRTVNQQSDLILNMNRMMTELVQSQRSMQHSYVAMESRVAALETAFEHAVADRDSAYRKLALLKTPPPPAALDESVAVRPEKRSAEGLPPAPAPPAKRATAASTESTTEVQSLNSILAYSAKAKADEEAARSNANIELWTILLDLYKNTQQFFQKELDFSQLSPPKYITTEKSKFGYCMELVEVAVTEEQRESLKKRDLPEADLLQLVKDIQAECRMTLCRYEGQNPDSTRMKMYYTGLGARVAKYKTKQGLKDQKLGPPTGQSTIDGFYGKSNQA